MLQTYFKRIIALLLVTFVLSGCFYADGQGKVQWQYNANANANTNANANANTNANANANTNTNANANANTNANANANRQASSLEVPLFKDVKPGAWYYCDVEAAVLKGFMKGFPDQTFRPNDLVTCGQALSTIANAIGEKVDAKALSKHWASIYAQRYFRIGGTDYETLLDNPIQRGLLFDILNNEFKVANCYNDICINAEPQLFMDVEVLRYKPIMNFLYAAGIVKSSAVPGKMKANLDAYVTRAELCALLLRAQQFKQNPEISEVYLKPEWRSTNNPFAAAMNDQRIKQHPRLEVTEEAIRDAYVQALVDGKRKMTIVYDVNSISFQGMVNRIYAIYGSRRDLQPTHEPIPVTYHQKGDYVLLEIDVQLEDIKTYYQRLNEILLTIFPDGYASASEEEKVHKITSWLLNNFSLDDTTERSSAYGLEALPNRKGTAWSYSSLHVALLRLAGLEAYTVDAFVRDSKDPSRASNFADWLTSVVVEGTTYYFNLHWCEITRGWGDMEYYYYTKERISKTHIIKGDIGSR